MSMIRVENLTFAYPSSYDNIFENVNFQIDTDWKLGFVGRNGRGKTTFLNLSLGKYEYHGKIQASVQFDYFPYPVNNKNRLTTDILSEVCPLAEEWELLRELSYLEVRDDVLWRPFFTLSNGEQTKVLLAALFLNDGHFLLIDEPTNHLDMKARETVSAYLKRKKGFILIFTEQVPNFSLEPESPEDMSKELLPGYVRVENHSACKAQLILFVMELILNQSHIPSSLECSIQSKYVLVTRIHCA